MSGPLGILYVGPLNAGSTCLQRREALAQLGHRVTGVDQLPGDLATRQRAFTWRVRRRLFGDRDDSDLNARLLARPASPAPFAAHVGDPYDARAPRHVGRPRP